MFVVFLLLPTVYKGFNATDLDLYTSSLAPAHLPTYSGWDMYYTPPYDAHVPDQINYDQHGTTLTS